MREDKETGQNAVTFPSLNAKEQGPDFHPAPLVMRFARLHSGVQKSGATNCGVLSKLRHQAKPLCRIPKQTAKFSGKRLSLKQTPFPISTLWGDSI